MLQILDVLTQFFDLAAVEPLCFLRGFLDIESSANIDEDMAFIC